LLKNDVGPLEIKGIISLHGLDTQHDPAGCLKSRVSALTAEALHE
jgi:hypothetical protein